MKMNNTTIILMAKHFFKNPQFMVKNLFYRYFPNIVPDKWCLEVKFYKDFGHYLDLKNPKTFNEKLQWLKLYDRNPLYTTLVDKAAVKQWVAKKIGEQYVIPTLGVWNSFDEIEFDKLPSQFVLKCTHDSGSVVICKDKNSFDFQHAKRILDEGLHRNFYYRYREWPYKNVKPRILAEKYLTFDDENKGLCDYKFFCFNGIPKFMFIATDRNNKYEETKFDFYDMEFKHLPFRNGHPNSAIAPIKPYCFDEMKQIASLLSANIPQVRVDFYSADDKVYFGEMTFYHWAGFIPFEPEEWDYKIGEMLQLPIRKK